LKVIIMMSLMMIDGSPWIIANEAPKSVGRSSHVISQFVHESCKVMDTTLDVVVNLYSWTKCPIDLMLPAISSTWYITDFCPSQCFYVKWIDIHPRKQKP
jgi:hypothetical protein